MQRCIATTGMLHVDLLPHNVVSEYDGAVLSLIDLESVVPAWSVALTSKQYAPPYCTAAAALVAGTAEAAAAQVDAAPLPFRQGLYRGCLTLRSASGWYVCKDAGSAAGLACSEEQGSALRLQVVLRDGGCLSLRAEDG